jgi:hypothetical protein
VEVHTEGTVEGARWRHDDVINARRYCGYAHRYRFKKKQNLE